MKYSLLREVYSIVKVVLRRFAGFKIEIQGWGQTPALGRLSFQVSQTSLEENINSVYIGYVYLSNPKYIASIVPNCIHPKSRFFHITMGNSSQEFILPPVNFQPAFLIIRQCQILITPRTRADSVRMPSACWCRIKTYLSFNIPSWSQGKSRNVASQVELVGSGCGKEVFPTLGEKHNI